MAEEQEEVWAIINELKFENTELKWKLNDAVIVIRRYEEKIANLQAELEYWKRQQQHKQNT